MKLSFIGTGAGGAGGSGITTGAPFFFFLGLGSGAGGAGGIKVAPLPYNGIFSPVICTNTVLWLFLD